MDLTKIYMTGYGWDKSHLIHIDSGVMIMYSLLTGGLTLEREGPDKVSHVTVPILLVVTTRIMVMLWHVKCK